MDYQSERKLIKLGRAALAMTLPKVWVDYMQLKAGDSVEVTANRKLTIKPITKTK